VSTVLVDIHCTACGGAVNINSIYLDASPGLQHGRQAIVHLCNTGELTDFGWRATAILGGDFSRKTHNTR
jgi:hypothetical protein